MKFAVRTLSLLGLLLLPGCGSQVQNTFKIQADLRQAQYYAQLSRTAPARLWADRAIAVDPNALSTYLSTSTDNADGSLSVAEVFDASGDEPTLRDYMKQAAAKFPDDYRPLQFLDETYGLLGDTPDQRATATTLAALLEKKIAAPGSQHDKDLTLALAQAYCDAGNFAKGVADYQAVVQAGPNDPDPLNALAYTWADANSVPNLPQALADVRQALVLLPKQSGLSEEQVALRMNEYLDTLGWVQHRMGDDKGALSSLQSAISISPRMAVERYHLGMVYEALRLPDAARAEFTHAALLAQGYAAPQQELSRLKETAAAMPLTAQR